MIIDFHTHIFPDEIAEKAIRKMEIEADTKAYINGTLSELKHSMEEANIDISIVLPVVTSPRQFHTINAFAKKISKEERIISFGGIHPDTEDIQGNIDTIVSYGLKGIKLHPDYHKHFVDDEKTKDIVQYAINRGLHVLFHAGVDIGYPNPIHCTPSGVSSLLERCHYGKENQGQIILAHTGGYLMWDDVEKFLVGKNIYFDLAYSLGKIPEKQLLRMICNHGVDKFLFATDSPWDNQKEDVNILNSLPITSYEKEAILGRNACRLLECRF